MRHSHRSTLWVASCVAMLLVSVDAFAAPDHLICRDAKEAALHTSYSADLVSAVYAGTGCVVKAPAKILCEEATTSNVTPPPTNAQFHGRGNPGRFLCYALKCPKDVDTVTMADPFGTHTMTLKGSKLLCAPEVATEFSSCAGPGADCNSCSFGCATHQDASPPANVCVNPGACYGVDVPCGGDADCLAGYACVTDPFVPMQTACCAACAP